MKLIIKRNYLISFFGIPVIYGLIYGLLFPLIEDLVNIPNLFDEFSNFLLILLTGFYVILTYGLFKTNLNLVNENNRPDLYFNIEFDENKMWLVIENVGRQMAKEISFDITKGSDLKISNERKLKDISFLKIKNLPAGKKYRTFLGMVYGLYDDESNIPIIDLKIHYTNNAKQYSYEYYLDFSDARDLSWTRSQNPFVKQLDKLAKSFDKTMVKIYKEWQKEQLSEKDNR